MDARATQHARAERTASARGSVRDEPVVAAPAGRPRHGGQGFEREAAQRVLRRAIELAERDSQCDRPDLVSEAALAEAAEELGMDPGVVRRAAAEERLGVLADAEQRLDRLAGPAVVSATQVVDAPASQVLAMADQWLRRSGLRRRRLDEPALSADYVRRADPVATTQRLARSISGREHLGRIRRVRVVVQPLDEHRSVVALVADLSAERGAAVLGGSALAGAGSVAAVGVEVGIDAIQVWPLLGIPVSVSAGYGVVRLRAATVPDVEVALQGVLDRVARPDPVPTRLTDVRDRLLGGLERARRGA
jgi:hypothetical protein